MTSAESIAVAEKLMALLKSAASLGMTATLNLETRNGRICTTFICEEFMNSDGKPSSDAGKKKHKSKGCLERSKERMIKYQNNKKKDMKKRTTGEKTNLLKRIMLKLQRNLLTLQREKDLFQKVFLCVTSAAINVQGLKLWKSIWTLNIRSIK